MRNSFLLALMTLTACQGDADAPTAAENRQLDEAADMLNAAPANLETIDDSGLAEANGSDEGSRENPATAAAGY